MLESKFVLRKEMINRLAAKDELIAKLVDERDKAREVIVVLQDAAQDKLRRIIGIAKETGSGDTIGVSHVVEGPSA